jgi:hypothetical protein
MRMDGTESRASRRNFLIAMAGAVPVVALGSVSAKAKMTQAGVGYQTEPKDGKQCSQCNFFVEPNSCKVVDGEITPTGYCKLWNKKAS